MSPISLPFSWILLSDGFCSKFPFLVIWVLKSVGSETDENFRREACELVVS